MPRSTRLIALGAATILAGCSERTGPTADPMHDHPAESRLVVPGTPTALHGARERLARRLAIALGDPTFRAQVKGQLDRSPVREHKLHLQRFLAGADRGPRGSWPDSPGSRKRRWTRMRAGRRRSSSTCRCRSTGAPGRETANILVATAHRDREAPVAFTTAGKRVILDPAKPPSTPVLAVVPVETNFDQQTSRSQFQGGNTGGSSNPPARALHDLLALHRDLRGVAQGKPGIRGAHARSGGRLGFAHELFLRRGARRRLLRVRPERTRLVRQRAAHVPDPAQQLQERPPQLRICGSSSSRTTTRPARSRPTRIASAIWSRRSRRRTRCSPAAVTARRATCSVGGGGPTRCRRSSRRSPRSSSPTTSWWATRSRARS